MEPTFSPKFELPNPMPEPPASRKDVFDMLGKRPHGRHIIRIVYREDGNKYWERLDDIQALDEFLSERGVEVLYLTWFGKYSQDNIAMYDNVVGDDPKRKAGEVLTVLYRRWTENGWVKYRVKGCVYEYTNIYDLINDDLIEVYNVATRRDAQFYAERKLQMSVAKKARFGGMRTPTSVYQFRNMREAPAGWHLYKRSKADLHIVEITD